MYYVFLDTYAVNFHQNHFNKVYRAKHVLSKVEGTPRAQRNALCHFDRREKSFLDPSHLLVMMGLARYFGVLCVFARVIFLPILYSKIQPEISNYILAL